MLDPIIWIELKAILNKLKEFYCDHISFSIWMTDGVLFEFALEFFEWFRLKGSFVEGILKYNASKWPDVNFKVVAWSVQNNFWSHVKRSSTVSIHKSIILAYLWIAKVSNHNQDLFRLVPCQNSLITHCIVFAFLWKMHKDVCSLQISVCNILFLHGLQPTGNLPWDNLDFF